MILVDASVLFDYFKGSQNKGTEKLEQLLELQSPLGITYTTYQELLQGSATEKDFNTMKAYLETQEFVTTRNPKKTYENAASLYIQCQKANFRLKRSTDCLTAQIAIENDLSLLHHNHDFSLIKSLSPLKVY